MNLLKDIDQKNKFFFLGFLFFFISGCNSSSTVWSSFFQNAEINPNTEVVVISDVAINDVLVESAFSPLAMVSQVEVDIALDGLSVSFSHPGGWPLGFYRLTFLLFTDIGEVAGEVLFKVVDLASPSGGASSCSTETFLNQNSRIVFSKQNSQGGRDLFSVSSNNLQSAELKQMTSEGNFTSLQSNKDPDGRISFMSDRDGMGDFEIFRTKIDGSNLCQVTSDNNFSGSPSLTEDGQKMVWKNSTSIVSGDLDGMNQMILDTEAGFSIGVPKQCPNGTIIFLSTESGNTQVWSMDSDGNNQMQVTVAGPVNGLLDCCESGGNTYILYARAIFVFEGDDPKDPAGTFYMAELDGSMEEAITWGNSGSGASFNDDCSQIAFTRSDDSLFHLMVAGSSGANERVIFSFPEDLSNPSW